MDTTQEVAFGNTIPYHSPGFIATLDTLDVPGVQDALRQMVTGLLPVRAESLVVTLSRAERAMNLPDLLGEPLYLNEWFRAYMKDLARVYERHQALGVDPEFDAMGVVNITRGLLHLILDINSVNCLSGSQGDSNINDTRIHCMAAELIPDLPDGAMSQMFAFIEGSLAQKGYRRHGEEAWKSVRHNGIDVNHWVAHQPIIDCIYDELQSPLMPPAVKSMFISTGRLDQLAKMVAYAADELRLPKVKRDRGMVSFTNGVYDMRNHAFVSHEEARGICTYIYHPVEFTHVRSLADWRSIETPAFDHILHTQFGAEDDYEGIYRTALVLLGRLFYDIGTLDNWQVMPFFKGRGGTGKGTIIEQVIRGLFRHEDTGVISGVSSKEFGLEHLYQKAVVLIPDVDEKFNMPMSVWKSLVSGDGVSVNIKGKTAINIPRWTAPMIMAGNSKLNYTGNNDALGRRIILFKFTQVVSDEVKNRRFGPREVLLAEAVGEERPQFLQKANMAYLEAVREWGKADIWGNLPEYFITARREMVTESTPVMELFRADELVFEEGAKMTFDDFMTMYGRFCTRRHLSDPRMDKDGLKLALNDYASTVKMDLYMSDVSYGGRPPTTWIFGMRDKHSEG